MPSFQIFEYTAGAGSIASSAVETLIGLAGKGPYAVSASGPGVEALVEAYPELAPFREGDRLSTLNDVGMPTLLTMGEEWVRALFQPRRFRGSRTVYAAVGRVEAPEAADWTTRTPLYLPCAPVRRVSLEWSGSRKALVRVTSTLHVPPRGGLAKRHDEEARSLIRRFGARPQLHRRDLYASADSRDAAEKRTSSAVMLRPLTRAPHPRSPEGGEVEVFSPAPLDAEDSLLGRAARAIDADDTAAAQRALLDAWREVRHPDIADALDLVSEEHLARHGGLTEKGKARKERLTELSHDLPAELQPAFCAALNEQSNADVLRLFHLAQPDPRWTSPLLRRVSASKRWTEKVLLRFLRFMMENGDSRLSRSEVDERGVPTYDTARFALLDPDRSIRLSTAVFKLSDKDFGRAPALDAETSDALARLLEWLRPMRERRTAYDLRLSVLARDGDQEGFAVLGDQLEEDGYMSRARFVRLQAAVSRGERLTRAETSEAKALVAAYQAVWAGPFADLADQLSFERGVPVRGRQRCTDRALEVWATHPLGRNLTLTH
jgi:hypothetical protein